MAYNRFKPNSFWEYVGEKPSVWATPFIGILAILIFAGVPATGMVLDGGTITPICIAYFILAVPYVIFAGAMILADPLGILMAIGCCVSPSVIVIICQIIGANIVAMFIPGVSAIDIDGNKDFLLYPGMAFRNAGFVMIPFLLYSLLALLRAKIQWENITSNGALSTSRW